MNDQKIREILSAYVEEGMRQLNEEKMAGADHVYSPKYEKKIKRMLWTEQYFGKHLKLGYALRYAAVFALVVLSMFAANETIASDGAYDHKEKFVVCGYKGTYYTKKDEEWVIWNDSQYYHKINATHLAKGKEKLQKMAQSLYLNN